MANHDKHKDRRYQAMRYDGQTLKPTAITRFGRAETADAAARRARRALPAGSSDWFRVEETRRKGRRR